MTEAISQSTKRPYHLVKYRYRETDDPEWALYTDSPVKVLGPDGHTYLPVPNMKVEIPENTGLLGTRKTKGAEVALPMDSFLERLSSSEPHEPVLCWIYEIIEATQSSGVATTSLLVYQGRVGKVRRHYKGNSGIVQTHIMEDKLRWDIQVGVSAEANCIWELGDVGCGINLPTYHVTGTIVEIDNTVARITGVNIENKTGKYFHRGRVMYLGNWVDIRNWSDAEVNTFFLSTIPPQEWLNKNVTVVPGCDQTIGVCRGRWNNESNHASIGIAIPSYHPIVEQPLQ